MTIAEFGVFGKLSLDFCLLFGKMIVTMIKFFLLFSLSGLKAFQLGL